MLIRTVKVSSSAGTVNEYARVNEETLASVSMKNPRAGQVLNALGVKSYRPLPPSGEQSVM